MATRRIDTSTSGWSNLCADLSYSLLNRFSLYDKFLFRGVCKSWRSLANTNILMTMSQLSPQPLIVLPTLGYERFGYDVTNRTKFFSRNSPCCLYKVEDKDLIMIKSLPEELVSSPCLGSSRGWLVFFDYNRKRYYLFNPIIDVRVSLGSLPKLPYTSKIVLWSDPILSGSKYAVVAIYELAKFGCQWKIAYAICGDNSWSFLDSENYPYCDVICDNKCLYALSESGYVEAWEFRDCLPMKTIRVPPPFPPRIVYEYSKKGLFTSRCYLVKSQDNLLMVVRNMQVLGSIYGNEIKIGNRSLSWQCKTLYFQVYRLKTSWKSWVKTENLGDRIIVLGANQSISLSGSDCHGYEKNSIYFSDDYWGLNFRDYHDHRCDTGVFNLGDGSINFFLESYLMDAHPPPFWFVPHFNL